MERDPGLDLVRVTAAAMVVLLHTSGDVFMTFQPGWEAAVVLDALSRSAIPLFFMLSGALLVPRSETLGSTGRRVLTLLLILALWSAFYAIWYSMSGVQWGYALTMRPELSGAFLARAATSPVVFHLWFLFALVGVYLLMPLLGAVYRSATSEVLAFSAVVLIGLPGLVELQRLFGLGSLSYLPNAFVLYVGYALAGATLRQWANARHLWPAVMLFAVSTVLTTVGTIWLSAAEGAPTESLFKYGAAFVIPAALGAFVFLLVIGRSIRPNGNTARLVRSLAPLTLGIYLLHPVILYYLGRPVLALASLWVSIPVAFVVVLMASTALTWLVAQTPARRLLAPA